MEDAVERAAALREYAEHTAGCTKCALAGGRTQVEEGDRVQPGFGVLIRRVDLKTVHARRVRD